MPRTILSIKTNFLFLLILVLTTHSLWATPTASVDIVSKTQSQYKALSVAIHSNGQEYGRLGSEVLYTAYTGLLDLHKKGMAQQVELVDLWAFALQGAFLFTAPDRLWGTANNAGGSSVGPWALSPEALKLFGSQFGADPSLTPTQLVKFMWQHPEIQAKIAALVINDSYLNFGKRSPYALQNYYDLKDFIKQSIGQGPWTSDLSGAVTSGFYAKQVLLGNQINIHGLLYWLWVLNDMTGIKQVIKTWAGQKLYGWDEKKNWATPLTDPAKLALSTDDIVFCVCHPAFKNDLKKLIISTP